MRVWIQPAPDTVVHLTLEQYGNMIRSVQRRCAPGDDLNPSDALALEYWSHVRVNGTADGGVLVEVYRRTAK